MPANAPQTVFGKIAAGELPADIIYQDELCLAFRDIHPQAPVHILVIPRKPLRSLAEVRAADKALLGHLMAVIAHIAEVQNLDADGYRVVTNVGRHGGQTVPHLHFHILAGRQLGWPPG